MGTEKALEIHFSGLSKMVGKKRPRKKKIIIKIKATLRVYLSGSSNLFHKNLTNFLNPIIQALRRSYMPSLFNQKKACLNNLLKIYAKCVNGYGFLIKMGGEKFTHFSTISIIYC